jgi:ATP-binding cassette subfamily B protein
VAAVAWPYRGLLLAALGCVLAGAGLDLVPPLVIKRVVDGHLTTGRPEGLLALGLLYFAATAALQGTAFLTAYLTAVAAQGALHDLRVRLFAHYQRLPLAYFDRTPTGEAISRCTADIETIDVLFSTGVAALAAELVRLVAVTGALLVLSPPLAALAALVVPPLVLVTRLFQVRVRGAERATRAAVGQLNAHLQEALAGVEVVRAFAREPYFVARFRRALRHTLAASNVSFGYAAVYP